MSYSINLTLYESSNLQNCWRKTTFLYRFSRVCIIWSIFWALAKKPFVGFWFLQKIFGVKEIKNWVGHSNCAGVSPRYIYRLYEFDPAQQQGATNERSHERFSIVIYKMSTVVMTGQQSVRSPAPYGMYASEALNRARSTGSWPELPPKLLITVCFIVGSKGGNLTAREINELNCGSVFRCTWSCLVDHSMIRDKEALFSGCGDKLYQTTCHYHRVASYCCCYD